MDFEFFTWVDLDPSNGLKLPEKFANLVEGREPDELRVCEVGNRRTTTWEMDVEFEGPDRMLLKGTWSRFAHIYGLEKGYILMCTYDGDTMLTVKVFDNDMCRVRYNDNCSRITGMDAAGFEFFKVILDNSEKMRLPPPFVDLLKDRGLSEINLREEGDTSLWDVGVVLEDNGRMYLKRGWQAFAGCFNLNYGDFVHFCFDGYAVLTVKVFAPTMCRIHYEHCDDSSSDGSDSDGNGSYSSDDSDEIIERRPGIRGDLIFDDYCIFGNKVQLNKTGVLQLNEMADDAAENLLKYYVCRMIPSSLDKQKGKMEFGPEFTKAGLKNYLKTPVEVNVGCTANGERHNMMMKMGADKKKAILSRGWTKAMTSYNIKKGANVIFCFKPNGPGKLLLEMIVMN